MKDSLSRLLSVFGTELPHPLFYAFEFGLRFELAGDVSGSVPRFIQAYNRARTVTNFLFDGQPPPLAMLSYYGDAEEPAQSLFSNGVLGSFGLEGSTIFHLASRYEADADSYRHWAAFDRAATPEVMLWSSIASELGIRPTLPGWHYLIDFERKIIVCPYDDRGMDVIAMDRDTLASLYSEFNNWLLDHDRERMDKTFAQ